MISVQKINKALGLYPTPPKLVQRVLKDGISDEALSDGKTIFIEPAAGDGNFVIGLWELASKALTATKLAKLVGNTICFENDHDTFLKLKINLANWLTENGIKSKPILKEENFLLSGPATIRKIDSCVIFGNPPWDEYTTRKHDDTSDLKIVSIRDERKREAEKYRKMGHRNVYQSFLFECTHAPENSVQLLFVLPRQLLGDSSAFSIRSKLLQTGNIKINSYRNGEHPDYEFGCVDKNFEIIILNHLRTQTASPTGVVKIARGFGRTFNSIRPVGEDLTIPCPRTNEEIFIQSKLLEDHQLSSWIDAAGISIKMGAVKHYEPRYKAALSGRTVSAYDVHRKKKLKLVVNKILPNSERKIKAALVGIDDAVNESLIEIRSDDQRFLKYLFLLLNSKMIDSALRSLVSNINLNIFRLKSLPIPPPKGRALDAIDKLFDLVQANEIDPNRASSLACKHAFALTKDVTLFLDSNYSDHRTVPATQKKAA